jgi:hypothetical protein
VPKADRTVRRTLLSPPKAGRQTARATIPVRDHSFQTPMPLLALLRRAAACALLLLPLLARAADFTDLWYNPAEPGWGVNVVESDPTAPTPSFLFLTFFIYGQDNKPTWYTGQLQYDSTTSKYVGKLYATQGTFFVMPWPTPNLPPSQEVGTVTFTPSTANAWQATLAYTVTGVGSATKAIQRQTLTKNDLAGAYVGGEAYTYDGCDSSVNGPHIKAFTLAVTHPDTGAATLSFTYPGTSGSTTCTMTGNLEPHGKLATIPSAQYSCSGPTSFTATATTIELQRTALGIEGRWASVIFSSCTETAQFAATF